MLQADLEASSSALQAAHTLIEKDATQDTLEALGSLECSHERLLNKVDLLYASLNIHDRFPELHGVDLEFVRTLLLVRNLKINIRKRAIGSFFEWDKLNHAVGGKQKALGACTHFPIPYNVTFFLCRHETPPTNPQDHCKTSASSYVCHP